MDLKLGDWDVGLISTLILGMSFIDLSLRREFA